MIYDYLIAGVHLRCRIPYELHMEAESAEFLFPQGLDSQPDSLFTLEGVKEIHLPSSCDYQAVNALYCHDEEGEQVYHFPGPGREAYAKISWQAHRPYHLAGEYVRSMEGLLNYSGDLMKLLSLESLLLRHDALLLHAAFVEWEGKAILFSGPSGIGKSTQAALWQHYQNARVLNGDRAALRKKEGVWHAWGLPYAGSSGIYRNESAPLGAIVVLEQGEKNEIFPLSSARAMLRLYPELMLHRWNRNFVEAAMDLGTELLTNVPVWLLRCRPDEEATQILKETLEKEGRL